MELICHNPRSTIDSDHRFEGKTVIITGAGGQFGRDGCLYFARRGARIAALDLQAAALQETLTAVAEAFGYRTDHEDGEGKACNVDFATFICDVTNAEQINLVVSVQIAERFPSIDMLWNNAGYQGQIQTTLLYDTQDFSNVMNINVTGMFIVLQAVARQMVKQLEASTKSALPTPSCAGTIVNTASVAGLRGTPGMIAYSSSKAAVIAMTVTAAKDLAPYQIRVNAVSPALIGPGFMWDRQNDLHAQLGPPYYASSAEQVAQNKINSVPMKRLGSVQEVIQSVAFLLSSESSYTTGVNLTIDGGMSAGIKG